MVPAITLAGAAEELLGKAVQDRAAFAVLKRQLAADFELPEKVVSQDHLNKGKKLVEALGTTGQTTKKSD